ncbi:uncharacterized protein LOC110458676 [Mizuhopecten yessoensis]|nr:uncharacterized protein LOC110458676 [Mizuhopecten yessoensis]
MSHIVTAQAYDHASNRIFYGVAFQLYVYSMRIDGSDVRKEATTDLYVQALAVDSFKQSMFVYSTSKGNIYRVRLGQDWTMDQSNAIHSGEAEVFHMAVDPHISKLIWGSYNGVFQSNYDGTDKERIFTHSGYIDGVTFDESSIYVLSEDTVWKVDRSTLLFYVIYQQHNSQSGFDLSGLVATGGHVYFGKYHCTYNPSADCIIGIARVRNGGTMYEDVGPILRTTFIQTPKLVHKSGAKQLRRCRDEVVDDTYLGSELNHRGEINDTVVVVLVVCPLVIVAAAALFFLWSKVFTEGRRSLAEGYITGLESPHNIGDAVGTNSQLSNNAIYTVPNVNSEKAAIEKHYREMEAIENQYHEIHVYDQIK